MLEKWRWGQKFEISVCFGCVNLALSGVCRWAVEICGLFFDLFKRKVLYCLYNREKENDEVISINGMSIQIHS
jgi:hypothetical protein